MGSRAGAGALVAHWSAATRRMVVNGYGRWLTWLAGKGQLDPAHRRPSASRLSMCPLYGRPARGCRRLHGRAARRTGRQRHARYGAGAGLALAAALGHQLRAGATRPQSQRAACRSQENDATTVPPDKGLSNHSLKLSEWPAQDQAAWSAALQPGDVLEPGGVAARLGDRHAGRWWSTATATG